MRLVGAKNSYIRGPFLLEGAWIGLLGAVVPAGLVYFIYEMAYKSFNPSLASQNLSMIVPKTFIPLMISFLFVVELHRSIWFGSINETILENLKKK